MAEAVAVEPNVSGFFCHKCLLEINAKLPDTRLFDTFFDLSDNASRDDNDDNDELAAVAAAHVRDGPSQNTRSRTRRELGTAAAGQRRRRNTPGGRADATTPLEMLLHQILGGLTGTAVFTSGSGGMPLFLNLHGEPGDYAWGHGGLDSIITRLLNQLDGAGPPPAPEHTIDKLPRVNITPDQVARTLQCSVCMEEFVLAEEVTQLPCDHHFHSDCIVPWLKLHGTCPICRLSLSPQEDSNRQETDMADGSSAASSTDDGSNLGVVGADAALGRWSMNDGSQQD
ncbi:PREDICTED: E3 ubiquitin-protein ligase RNF126-B-like, partial [Priapulus caudatus]|uniref:E3 ubiquitin-protein ligase RNF126-B-like n=1 Tax=Priapulus caudatus TaxID=37621 RepID=A0ABM1E2S9_PRICU